MSKIDERRCILKNSPYRVGPLLIIDKLLRYDSLREAKISFIALFVNATTMKNTRSDDLVKGSVLHLVNNADKVRLSKQDRVRL